MNKQVLQEIVSQFNAPVRFAFAYGSGIFKQNSYASNAKPMLDLIFGVTHTEHWHSLNLRQYPEHYAPFMRATGSGFISKVQDMGGQVYFHPFVTINGTVIKYGIINIDKLLADLTEWRTFYMAGRMQKPNLLLRDDARVKLANRQNLYNAVRTAIFLLPTEFSEEELFLKIAGLSYNGDPRMKFLENPHKVYNIVYSQMDEFKKIYQPIIDDLPIINYVNDSTLKTDDNPKLLQQNLSKLPLNLLESVTRMHQQATTTHLINDGREFQEKMVSSGQIEKYINQAMVQIVSGPSRVQSIKGLLSAGLRKSIRYLQEKRSKVVKN